MIQVLDRAFSALELLAAEPRRAMLLGEIAEKLALNKATCAHIMQSLCQLSLAEQVAPRKGYRLGPGLYALGRGGGYRADLVSAAETAMRELAGEVRETVLLAVLRGRRRFTLCQIDGMQDVQVRATPDVEANVYQTATGRLLLAHAGKAERDAFIAEVGLPGSAWPEVTSRDELDCALVDIRGQDCAFHRTPTHVVAVAYPVWQNGRVVAALGLYLPEFRFAGEHRDAVLTGMARAAADISSQLASPGRASMEE